MDEKKTVSICERICFKFQVKVRIKFIMRVKEGLCALRLSMFCNFVTIFVCDDQCITTSNSTSTHYFSTL